MPKPQSQPTAPAISREKPLSPSVAALFMLACGVMWSLGGLLVKIIPWNSMVIAGTRSLIAAMCVLAYQRGFRGIATNKRTLLAALHLFLVMVLYVTAIKLTTAANAIVLQYLSPVFIILINLLLYKQRATTRQMVAVAGSIIGIGLFFFDQLSPSGVLGCILAILSGVFYAAFYVASNRLESQREVMSAIFYGHIYAFLFGIPFIFLYPPEITSPALWSVLALGVVQLGLPYVIYGRAIRYCAPLNAMLICMIEPLLNPVWVFLTIRERPGFFALIGAAVVIAVVTWWSVSSMRGTAPDLEEAVAGEAQD